MKNKKKKDVDTIKRMENWNLIGETPEEETKKKRNSMGQVSIPQQIKMDQAPPKLWTLISLSIFAAKYDQIKEWTLPIQRKIKIGGLSCKVQETHGTEFFASGRVCRLLGYNIILWRS
ncbi:uncharacterized protein LOC141713022 isoform X2 [Apium graveolens]|uniref:uncharacterized protein LOC141713022 isoform X2 n=1 Tax=Apium graveolens TaxID=4045 RepID=UPI003D7BE548